MSDVEPYDTLSVEDRMELTALATEYCWLKDFAHCEKIADLFTEDCVWEPPAGHPSGKAIRGRSAMMEAWLSRSKDFTTRTLISNVRFVKDSPTTAHGWVNFTEYSAHNLEVKVPHPLMVGDWVDTYQKGADGKWRIKTKQTFLAFGGLRVVG